MTKRELIERGRYVADAMEAQQGVDDDPQTCISDAICNLRHYMKAEGLDWELALKQANGHFEHEDQFGMDEDND